MAVEQSRKELREIMTWLEAPARSPPRTVLETLELKQATSTRQDR